MLTKNMILNKYAIIKINNSFSNYNIALTTLNGKILKWVSGGCDTTQKKRTRMTSRAIGAVMIKFLTMLRSSSKIMSLGIRYIKIQFTGPSKKYRGKFYSLVKRRARRLKFNIICQEEAFHRSFNGCRLSRKKRR